MSNKTKDDIISELEDKVYHLSRKIETDEYITDMQMAAISSISSANTKESMSEIVVNRDSDFWSMAFEDVRNAIKREILLLEKVSKLKQLLLLTDASVSNVEMNDLTMKQWNEFVKTFPDEGTT